MKIDLIRINNLFPGDLFMFEDVFEDPATYMCSWCRSYEYHDWINAEDRRIVNFGFMKLGLAEIVEYTWHDFNFVKKVML